MWNQEVVLDENDTLKGVDETQHAQSDVFTTYLPIVGYSLDTGHFFHTSPPQGLLF